MLLHYKLTIYACNGFGFYDTSIPPINYVFRRDRSFSRLGSRQAWHLALGMLGACVCSPLPTRLYRVYLAVRMIASAPLDIRQTATRDMPGTRARYYRCIWSAGRPKPIVV
jgi:hypothetical protein